MAKEQISRIMRGELCPYCLKPSKLVKGDLIYPRHPHLHERFFYACMPCKAWVGTHENSAHKKRPRALGRIANQELRDMKREAHASFDPIWQKIQAGGFSKTKAREIAYSWLSVQMDIPIHHCHIGRMTVEQCKQVIQICERLKN